MIAEMAEQSPSESPLLDEFQRLRVHRTMRLLDLGFSLDQTFKLVWRDDVVHDAEELLRQGASHEFVVDELG